MQEQSTINGFEEKVEYALTTRNHMASTKQKLPIAPVLPALPDKLDSMLPMVLPMGTEGHQYLVQQQEWTDDQLISGWHQLAVDNRRGKCATCDLVRNRDDNDTNDTCQSCDTKGMVDDDKKTRSRKGKVELPAATLQVAPFHYRNVKHALPDFPEPSEMQELQRKKEYQRNLQIKQEIRLRQQLLARQLGQAAIAPELELEPEQTRKRARES